MFDANIKKSINDEQTKFVSNHRSEGLRVNQQISTPSLNLPLKQQSVKSLHKITKHYKEFQHALHMLKTSVEELWRLELEQLHNHEPISLNPSNNRFDLQVPSTYTCRAVLPIVSETKPLEKHISSIVNSPLILQPNSKASTHETLSNKREVKEKMSPSPSNFQSVASTQQSKKSFHSISKKPKRQKSKDIFTKYWTKTALLHLKFCCPKHTH